MNTREAIKVAESRGLDLVEVAPAATPPSAGSPTSTNIATRRRKRPMTPRHATASAIKEVKMGALTEKHDVEFKVRTSGAF